jgi:glutamate synthase (NADPH/NADH)
VTFPKPAGIAGYEEAVKRVCRKVCTLIDHDIRVVILSDRCLGAERVPLSMLVTVGAVHHYLIRNKKRGRVALIA